MDRRTHTRVSAWALSCALAMAAACSDNGTITDAPMRAGDAASMARNTAIAAPTPGIALTDTSVTVNGTARFFWYEPTVTYAISGRNKVAVTPTWVVRDPNVVTYNSTSGMYVNVTAKAVGSTYVVGTLSGRKDSVKVTVTAATVVPPVSNTPTTPTVPVDSTPPTTNSPPVPPTTPPVTPVTPPVTPLPSGGERVVLPRLLLDTMVTGARNALAIRTIRPSSGSSLQAAIDTARFGDVIILTPGVTYVGTTTLKRKTTGSGWITIRGSASIPGAGVRTRPSTNSSWPRLVANVGVEPALSTEAGAHHYLIQGVEITSPTGATQGYSLVAIGTSNSLQSTVASQPNQIVFDHDFIHGSTSFDFQRCLLLNGGAIAVVDSWVSDCHGRGYDSQAIAMYNGSGPFKIQNNYLEGAGENILVGGADAASLSLMPADIEIRGNHIFKPLGWAGMWTIKNLVEFKVGLRVLMEGNVLENCWADAQGGTGLVMKSVNQESSAPFSETRDVTFRGNIIRNVVNAIGLAGHPEAAPAVYMSHVAIQNNWFDQLSGYGVLMSTENVSYLYVEANTGSGTRAAFRFNGGGAVDSLILRNNVFTTSQAGPQESISGDGVMYGVTALNTYARSWVASQNVLIGAPTNFYPTGNFYPGSASSVGFQSLWVNPTIVSTSTFAGLGAPVSSLISMSQSVIVTP